MKCVAYHHNRQMKYSSYFIDCDRKNIEAEVSLLQAMSEDLGSDDPLSGNCSEIFNRVPLPDNSSGRKGRCLALLNAQ